MEQIAENLLEYGVDNSNRIKDKAFFNNHLVRELQIPESVTEIGNWCFAHAINLRKLQVPAHSISMGKKAFQDCPALKQIMVDGGNEFVAECLANAYRDFPEKMLGSSVEICRDFSIAGDEGKRELWQQSYDEALLQFMNRSDDADYEPVFIGWFDVEDFDDQQLAYKQQIRVKKQRLLIHRLARDYEADAFFTGNNEEVDSREFPIKKQEEGLLLRDRLLECLTRYQNLSVDKDTLTLRGKELLKQGSELLETWLPRDAEFGNRVSSYKVWKETGSLDSEVIGRLLLIEDLDPEVRAYLILQGTTGGKQEDAFAGFEL